MCVGHRLHRAHDIAHQQCALLAAHQPVKVTRLRVIVVVVAMIVAIDRARQRQGRRRTVVERAHLVEAVGMIVGAAAAVAVETQPAVAMIMAHFVMRLIDGDLMVVDAQTITMRIGVGEEAALQHAIGRKAQAGHDRRRRERRLLDVGEVVVGVAIEDDLAHFHTRIVLMRPHFGDVEWIDIGVDRLRFRHDLNEHRPARMIAALDGLEEIALRMIGIAARQLQRFAPAIDCECLALVLK